ncbi:MAG: peptide-methionine (R)-S-oxide reductase MsrB [Vulcanimicrobiota bacterium]
MKKLMIALLFPLAALAVPPKVVKTDEQWKKQLTPQEYAVLRQAATEPAFTGKYEKNHEKGTYYCAACGNELFKSETKFDSGCGWPAFFAVAAKDKVVLLKDDSHGMNRVEVRCAACNSHLGHVFEDGPQPTGLRYCINSISLKFKPAK